MAQSSSKSSKTTVGKEFLCKVRYHNPLPPVPFPQKLLPIPPTYVEPDVGSYSQARLQHYVQYRHTTLEEATPYPLMVDADYGMPIDPCLLGVFDDTAHTEPQPLDPEDEFLLNLPTSSADRTAEPTTRAPAAASRALGPARTNGTRRPFDHSRAGQLQAIDDSFHFFSKFDNDEEMLRSLRHPTNSKLRAVEAMPLLPNETLWPTNYVLFSLDADPAENCSDVTRESLVFLSQQGSNELGETDTWCEAYLPESEDTARRMRENTADASEYRLRSARDYDAQSDPSTQSHYMITVSEEDSGAVASYVRFQGKLLLKRSNVARTARNYSSSDAYRNLTNIDLQMREPTQAESLERTQKLDQLRAPTEPNHTDALDSDQQTPYSP
ncbi:hypothetical protein GGH16_002878 [Coemansia sp. RSA 560]|nr:hypothetical protein GGH16_002878 [Coemansia sp. RSA 560]